MSAQNQNAVRAAEDVRQDRTGQDASEAQRRAADAGYSVWVGASAGSGKTKVLTDRVLRLLLPQEDGKPGTAPHRILCLTFTKAAAREMALRLNRRLGRWAVMTDDELAADLRDNLLGRVPTMEECAAARKLFARVIDTPGGLKIMTIHAFCQSVLARFPLEAGLPPHFKALEAGAASALLARARDEVAASARQDPASPAGKALTALAAAQGADGFTRLMQDIVGERHQLGRILAECGGIEGAAAMLANRLGIRADDMAEKILAGACADGTFDAPILRAACRVMAERGTEKTDQPRAVSIQNWLDAVQDKRTALYEDYRGQFLTKDGPPREKIMTAKLAGQYADEADGLRAEALRLERLEDKMRAASCVALTRGLLVLGSAVLEKYENFKRQRAALDFDDLIHYTLDLLGREGMAGWVMYKLDGGLDHILIDEAQDTNPEQWAIVQALSEDFFAGSGAREGITRTIFSVGDEKQSIYSFQRAAPDKFREMRSHFADKVQQAKLKWRNEDMNVSFRSVPAVLSFVDKVFADDQVRRGLGLSPLLHKSHRAGDGGLVEVWPLFETPAVEERDPWRTPETPVGAASGAARLAEHIGQTVRGWLDNGEILASRGRPVQPGDIMVLVRRRTAFVNQLIRALKTRDIPVSGIDRMVLKEQLAVQDMLALAQFALLPEDDLTLACVLKSPLVGWDDRNLETLAAERGRGTSLWTALERAERERPDAAPHLTYIMSWLRAQREQAGRQTPYAFFSRVLHEPCPADMLGGLHAMTGRLGAEVLDPLDEFLNMALSFEAENVPALQGFLLWAEQGDNEIKREQEEAGGRVRIMTVHGAKGLQAPIVFLPDTVRTSRTPPGASAHRLLWPDKTGYSAPVWSPRKDTDCEAYKKLLYAHEARQDEEYRRLLYVALTRAEDRLYIAGHNGQKKPLDESWYYYALRAVKAMQGAEESDFVAGGENVAEDAAARPRLYRLAEAQSRPARADRKHEDENVAPSDMNAYSWLSRPPPPEPDPVRPLTPSRPSGEEPAALSPLVAPDRHRFRRGIVTHRLLQLLPDLPPARREAAALAFTSAHAADLPSDVQAQIVAETLAVIDHPDWGALFGPGSRAEVSLTGLAGKTLVSGQIDRLVVRGDEVWIVDYKTNRPPPASESEIPAVYRQQMKAYSDIVAKIYPGCRIRAVLLWTDGPLLMPLALEE